MSPIVYLLWRSCSTANIGQFSTQKFPKPFTRKISRKPCFPVLIAHIAFFNYLVLLMSCCRDMKICSNKFIFSMRKTTVIISYVCFSGPLTFNRIFLLVRYAIIMITVIIVMCPTLSFKR